MASRLFHLSNLRVSKNADFQAQHDFNIPSLFQVSCSTSTIRTDPLPCLILLAVAHASLSYSTTRLIPALTKYRQLSRNCLSHLPRFGSSHGPTISWHLLNSPPLLSSSPATPAWLPLDNIHSIAPFAVAPIRGDGECECAVSSFFQQHRTLSFADSNGHFCWLEQVLLLQPQAIPQSIRLRREVSTRRPPSRVAV